MVALRVAIVLACVALVAWPVAHAVVAGLRTGRLPHTGNRAELVRSERPIGFWALMAAFLAMLGLLGYGAVLGVQRALA